MLAIVLLAIPLTVVAALHQQIFQQHAAYDVNSANTVNTTIVREIVNEVSAACGGRIDAWNYGCLNKYQLLASLKGELVPSRVNGYLQCGKFIYAITDKLGQSLVREGYSYQIFFYYYYLPGHTNGIWYANPNNSKLHVEPGDIAVWNTWYQNSSQNNPDGHIA